MQKSKTKLKVQKSSKKIAKLLLLLGIREGYLLTRNLYGMVEHPIMTFNRIYRKKDYSQAVLIFGIPIGLWLSWILVLLASRFFIFGRLKFGILAQSSFWFVSFSISLLLLLLGYCFYTVWKKKRREE